MSAKHMASGSSRPSYRPKGNSSYRASHSRSAGTAGNASQGASPYTQPYQPTASRYSGDAVSYVKSRKGAGAPGKPVRRGPRWWQILLIVLAVLIVVGGTCGFFMYEDLKAIKSEAQNAKQELAVYKDALMNGKSDELSSSAASLAQSTQTMADRLSSPLWTAAEIVPVYGQDVRQGRELVGVANDFMHNGLLPFSNDLNGVSIKSLVKDGGQVDIPILQKVVNAVLAIKVPLTDTIHKIQSLEPFHIQKINDVLEGAQSTLSQASDLLDEADDVLPQLPVMLGADGQTKTYLVVALNNVETRSSGGFPGAWGTMTVTDGKIALNGDFASLQNARQDAGTGFTPTDEESAAFDMGSAAFNPGSAMMTPQFPRAAEAAAQSWLAFKNQAVNGVVAVDPVFLQSLLAVTGQSVDVNGIHVDGSNAATVLMHDTYWNIPVDAQDAFFSGVAGASFQAIFAGLGHADSGDLAKTILDGALTRNFQVWMADPDQEAAIDALGFSGKLEADPAKPVLGTYTNDYTWSKMDWYLNMNTQVGEGVKNADGSTSYQVTTTVTNAMTPEEAAAAPLYVYGGNPDKRSQGDMLTHLYLLAPAGGYISDIQGQGGVFSVAQHSVYGYDEWTCSLQENPQETTTITYTVTTSPEATQPLTVSRTPAARSFS
ncbi:DUF4012 domain-containing protein [Olsenella sp. KGMB02461]|nr:DUF4012 domain-containing protein [Olsenella sp. KGMB02461]